MELTYTTPHRERATQTITFTLDKQTYTARRPKDSMFVLLAAANAGSATPADQFAAVTEFLGACLPPEDAQRLRNRLRDQDDRFEFIDLLAIMTDLAERFGDNDMPTFTDGAETAVPGKPFRTAEPAGATVIEPAAPNRAARRARPRTTQQPARPLPR